MKKIVLSILFIAFVTACAWSQKTYFAAFKAGLSIRDEASVNGKVIDKIPYAQKVETVKDNEVPVSIVADGYTGYWWKIKYKNKTGYVISSYLLPVAPPKVGTKTLKQYFAQIAKPVAAPLQVKKHVPTNIEDNGYSMTKQLFNNGMEYTESVFYESNEALYILPEFSTEQAFLLLRLMAVYPDLITEKTSLPVASSGNNNPEDETIVERYNWDAPAPVKKLSITKQNGAIFSIEIYTKGNQAFIFYAAGV
ncbi:MAG: SH3 domain-containing protein [Ferruginibacter sp.]